MIAEVWNGFSFSQVLGTSRQLWSFIFCLFRWKRESIQFLSSQLFNDRLLLKYIHELDMQSVLISGIH